jgi:hypothetical protein
MKTKKIMLISYILNTIALLIPIQRKTITGFECDPSPCYEYFAHYGFPIPLFYPGGVNSPISGINWEMIYHPLGILVLATFFIVNGLFFFAFIKILDFIYRKINKRKKRR